MTEIKKRERKRRSRAAQEARAAKKEARLEQDRTDRIAAMRTFTVDLQVCTFLVFSLSIYILCVLMYPVYTAVLSCVGVLYVSSSSSYHHTGGRSQNNSSDWFFSRKNKIEMLRRGATLQQSTVVIRSFYSWYGMVASSELRFCPTSQRRVEHSLNSSVDLR